MCLDFDSDTLTGAATDVCDSLLRTHEGDAISVTGALTPKVWTDKQGISKPALDMVAHRILRMGDGQHFD